MTHPKTPHLIFLPSLPKCSKFLFKQTTFTKPCLCMPSVRAKGEGKKNTWKGNEDNCSLGLFFVFWFFLNLRRLVQEM